ncbi:MAG: hypothetical protein OEZ34_12935 [Spirochaetia bacterium]|nr:hypothetical protein [Spirochaetia bacterium]
MKNQKETLALAVIWILLIGIFQSVLLSSIPDKIEKIYQSKKRAVITGSSKEDPSAGSALFDRNLNKAELLPFIKNQNSNSISHKPPQNVSFFQTELFVTHFPGSPPLANPLKEIILWPGTYESGIFSRKYARPSLIRLIFFEQEFVDTDREFRLPPPPFYILEKMIELPDREGPFIIQNTFLPAPKVSKKFPEHIFQIIMRVEILDIYPGNEFPEKTAIAEIDYRTEIPEHEAMKFRQSN